MNLHSLQHCIATEQSISDRILQSTRSDDKKDSKADTEL